MPEGILILLIASAFLVLWALWEFVGLLMVDIGKALRRIIEWANRG